MFNKAKFRISENIIRKTANKIGKTESTTEWDADRIDEQIAMFHTHDRYFANMSLEDFDETLQKEMEDIYHSLGRKRYAQVVSWIDMQFAFYRKLNGEKDGLLQNKNDK